MDTQDLQPKHNYSPKRGPRLKWNRAKESSLPNVGFVEGTRPHFADETAKLLRTRLQAIAFLLSVILAALFVANFFAKDVPLAGLRLFVLVVLVGSLLGLESRVRFSLTQLRFFEIGILGAVMVQAMVMCYAKMAAFAHAGDSASVIATEYVFLSAWSILILTYGILMPNSWQRAAAVLVPTACIPYVLIFGMKWFSPSIAESLRADHSGNLLPGPFVAVAIATFGAFTVNVVRREAFRARQLGQYFLKEQLGSGGMGEVYRAEHQLLKRPCAIKLIKPGKAADAQAIARFEREVQATASLTHWNTVEIYDYGRSDDGTFYYVMEFLPGLSLEQLVRRHGPLPPERAVHFLRQVCSALREAHACGLIHRDIKPANICAAERGGVCDVAKLLDFGLVRQQVVASEDVNLTQQGAITGSPQYMCPEQGTASGKPDARSDIYSLGAVAYYLVTGQPPFLGDSPMEIIVAHCRDPLKPPTEINASVPADLEAVITRCMAKKPDDRYQDAASLDQALAACQCVGKWTDDMATAWWREFQKKSI